MENVAPLPSLLVRYRPALQGGPSKPDPVKSMPLQAGSSQHAGSSQQGGPSAQRGTPSRPGLATLTGNVLTPQSSYRTSAAKTPNTATRTRTAPTRLPAAISDDSNIQVIVRVRPPAGPELTGYPGARCVAQDGPKSLFLMNPDKGGAAEQFTFDHVAGERAQQEDLFELAGRPIVENCLAGYNSTMFAYGQTGSGKTYTMFGADMDKVDLDRFRLDKADVEASSLWGMIPRVFQLVFALMKQERQQRASERLAFICTCSFLEIYNEHFYDLLDPKRTNLHIREGPNGVFVENLTKQSVSCFAEVMELIQRGAKNRRVAGTNMNRESSRSHSVFTCNIESTWTADGICNRRFGQLNLVDLAGSERQKSSGATGERLKEASSINTSLSQLGNVIMVLVESLRENRPRHVPYRDSYLTFLLQDSLGGNSKTTMIACISPFAGSYRESLGTLKFAQRAKLVHNKAVVNEATEGEKDALKKEIARLKDELQRLRKLCTCEAQLLLPSSSSSSSSPPFSLCRSLATTPATPRNPATTGAAAAPGDAACTPLALALQERANSPRHVQLVADIRRLEVTLAGALRRERELDRQVEALKAENETLRKQVAAWGASEMGGAGGLGGGAAAGKEEVSGDEREGVVGRLATVEEGEEEVEEGSGSEARESEEAADLRDQVVGLLAQKAAAGGEDAQERMESISLELAGVREELARCREHLKLSDDANDRLARQTREMEAEMRLLAAERLSLEEQVNTLKALKGDLSSFKGDRSALKGNLALAPTPIPSAARAAAPGSLIPTPLVTTTRGGRAATPTNVYGISHGSGISRKLEEEFSCAKGFETPLSTRGKTAAAAGGVGAGEGGGLGGTEYFVDCRSSLRHVGKDQDRFRQHKSDLDSAIKGKLEAEWANSALKANLKLQEQEARELIERMQTEEGRRREAERAAEEAERGVREAAAAAAALAQEKAAVEEQLWAIQEKVRELQDREERSEDERKDLEDALRRERDLGEAAAQLAEAEWNKTQEATARRNEAERSLQRTKDEAKSLRDLLEDTEQTRAKYVRLKHELRGAMQRLVQAGEQKVEDEKSMEAMREELAGVRAQMLSAVERAEFAERRVREAEVAGARAERGVEAAVEEAEVAEEGVREEEEVRRVMEERDAAQRLVDELVMKVVELEEKGREAEKRAEEDALSLEEAARKVQEAQEEVAVAGERVMESLARLQEVEERAVTAEGRAEAEEGKAEAMEQKVQAMAGWLESREAETIRVYAELMILQAVVEGMDEIVESGRVVAEQGAMAAEARAAAAEVRAAAAEKKVSAAEGMVGAAEGRAEEAEARVVAAEVEAKEATERAEALAALMESEEAEVVRANAEVMLLQTIMEDMDAAVSSGRTVAGLGGTGREEAGELEVELMRVREELEGKVAEIRRKEEELERSERELEEQRVKLGVWEDTWVAWEHHRHNMQFPGGCGYDMGVRYNWGRVVLELVQRELRRVREEKETAEGERREADAAVQRTRGEIRVLVDENGLLRRLLKIEEGDVVPVPGKSRRASFDLAIGAIGARIWAGRMREKELEEEEGRAGRERRVLEGMRKGVEERMRGLEEERKEDEKRDEREAGEGVLLEQRDQDGIDVEGIEQTGTQAAQAEEEIRQAKEGRRQTEEERRLEEEQLRLSSAALECRGAQMDAEVAGYRAEKERYRREVEQMKAVQLVLEREKMLQAQRGATGEEEKGEGVGENEEKGKEGRGEGDGQEREEDGKNVLGTPVRDDGRGGGGVVADASIDLGSAMRSPRPQGTLVLFSASRALGRGRQGGRRSLPARLDQGMGGCPGRVECGKDGEEGIGDDSWRGEMEAEIARKEGEMQQLLKQIERLQEENGELHSKLCASEQSVWRSLAAMNTPGPKQARSTLSRQDGEGGGKAVEDGQCSSEVDAAGMRMNLDPILEAPELAPGSGPEGVAAVELLKEKALRRHQQVLQKDHELRQLRTQLDLLIHEKEKSLVEMERMRSEAVMQRSMANKCLQKELALTQENAQLKQQLAGVQQQLENAESELQKLVGQHNLNQRIQVFAKFKSENNALRSQNEELAAAVKRLEGRVKRLEAEVGKYRKKAGQAEQINYDEEARLQQRLEEVERSSTDMAQKLLTVCQAVLQVTKGPHAHSVAAEGLDAEHGGDISSSSDKMQESLGADPSGAALAALNSLKFRIKAAEDEISDLKFQARMAAEKAELCALREQNSIISHPAQVLSPPLPSQFMPTLESVPALEHDEIP
ncbi:hypothetical protein CLOM_g528 [Closterium sp. NIES-68]|nr:hypothetical protein CLOM_g528 [Closterium sp. NIES-68]GJP69185.1 hypothetical protein CLOP_g137 [Closterium sp. NIES-67]